MKGVLICAALLCAAIAMMGTGITLLVMRYQAEAPQEYRDASINYHPRLPSGRIKVVVAKDDNRTVQARIERFIRGNGGTIEYSYDDSITATVPRATASHISLLNTKRKRLSPGYKVWPKAPPAANPREGPEQKIRVSITGVPYRKLMLDLGVGTTASGAIITVVAGILLIFLTKDELERRRDSKEAAERQETVTDGNTGQETGETLNATEPPDSVEEPPGEATPDSATEAGDTTAAGDAAAPGTPKNE